MASPIKIPTRADDSPRLLIWSVEQFLPIVAGFCFGIMLHQIFICTALGILLARYYGKFRDLHADGLAFHFFYHYGLFPTKKKSFVNPFIKILFP